MLVIPLAMGAISFFGACQWMIQDWEWQERLENMDSPEGEIYEVEESACSQPMPKGYGVVCAQSTEWWVQTDMRDCGSEDCYTPVWFDELIQILEEMERSYLPILVPGLLPLIFLFVVIRKIVKARRALQAALNAPP